MVTSINGQRQLVSNLNQAVGIYNADIEDVTQFDPGFVNALVGALAAELVMPLTGNIQLRGTLTQIALMEINEAKALDGAEAIPKVDHVPDWILARGTGSESSFAGSGLLTSWGMWNCDWSGGYAG
jgi:hypothetical protein